MRRAMVVGLIVAMSTQLLGMTVAGANNGRGGPGQLPPANPARGVVVADLAVATDGPCDGLLELLDVPSRACTHGPDPAPVELGDVRTGQWATEDAEQTAAAASSFACDGDGTSGRRAHAIYAVAPDREDKFATYEAAFRGRIAEIQDEVRQSSLLHGATDPLVYRFTHSKPVNGACEPLVDHVQLPRTTDDDSFSNTIKALQELGYTDPSRRYLVWVDANVLCGIATMYGDDDPSPSTNANNRIKQPLFSRVDMGCWGYAETHELVHNIGGVQSSAPNATGAGHCNDDHDVMCYADGGLLSALRIVKECSDKALWERRLDCNGDDYFNPAPPSGSYLDTHWNTADSGWLFREVGGGGLDGGSGGKTGGGTEPTPPAPAANPPNVSISTPVGGVTDRTLTFSGRASDKDGDLRAVRLFVDGRRVATVATTGRWSRTVTVSPGQRTLSVQAVDAAGNVSSRRTVKVLALADMPSPRGSLFVDDRGSMFEPAIERLAVQGVTRGCNPPRNTNFCPDQPVTRGQMAAFLVRALDLPAASGVDFRDDNGSIFEDAIERLAAAGVTRGCNPPKNTNFCPDQPVTRAQMAAFLERALYT